MRTSRSFSPWLELVKPLPEVFPYYGRELQGTGIIGSSAPPISAALALEDSARSAARGPSLMLLAADNGWGAELLNLKVLLSGSSCPPPELKRSRLASLNSPLSSIEPPWSHGVLGFPQDCPSSLAWKGGESGPLRA
mmetsp:Transcript_35830/g.87050  ORF Transcript_35830/g.87050 Transcript_35830/m.87050 type:complete len:137 (+) Transcript_35830:253-663(+)